MCTNNVPYILPMGILLAVVFSHQTSSRLSYMKTVYRTNTSRQKGCVCEDSENVDLMKLS